MRQMEKKHLTYSFVLLTIIYLQEIGKTKADSRPDSDINPADNRINVLKKKNHWFEHIRLTEISSTVSSLYTMNI